MEQLSVKNGQVTFDAEGNDVESSRYFSRVIHWPGNAESGVTIGRGYDMGNRTKAEVRQDLIKAGVYKDQADKLAEGARLKGAAAKEFVILNKDAINKLTRQQQVNLFNNIYPLYVARAKANYDKWTSSEPKRIEWEKLDSDIKDILVDFVYQGFTKGPRPMLKGMNNSKSELIDYIRNSSVMSEYESGRKRVQYLQNGGN